MVVIHSLPQIPNLLYYETRYKQTYKFTSLSFILLGNIPMAPPSLTHRCFYYIQTGVKKELREDKTNKTLPQHFPAR